jgi:hypothetical protein
LAKELALHKTHGKINDPYPLSTKQASSAEGTENTLEGKSSEFSEEEIKEGTVTAALAAQAQKQ